MLTANGNENCPSTDHCSFTISCEVIADRVPIIVSAAGPEAIITNQCTAVGTGQTGCNLTQMTWRQGLGPESVAKLSSIPLASGASTVSQGEKSECAVELREGERYWRGQNISVKSQRSLYFLGLFSSKEVSDFFPMREAPGQSQQGGIQLAPLSSAADRLLECLQKLK